MGRAAGPFRRPAAVAPLPPEGGGKARNPDRGTGQFICSKTGHIYLLTTGGRRYALSFYGVIDIMAILPAFIVQDALALRILRLFRIFTLFKLGRLGGAAHRMARALKTVKEEFLLVGVGACTVLLVSAFGIRHFEHEAQPEAFSDYGDCLWWAVASMITGEYGDVSPVTIGGKAFSTVILILSLGIIAAPAGLIASALSQISNEQPTNAEEQ